MLRTRSASVAFIVLAVLLIPNVAHAQGSGIAGVVKDTSGAVLPGVTVEGASPALIEKVRTVVTDAEGQYKIINLPPGTYAVTFTLPGFTIIRREGIELSAGFTSTVNAEMGIGALKETITVSGETPMVDVQNIVKQSVVTDEVVTALPTGRTYWGLGALIPGIGVSPGSAQESAQDVGGSSAEVRVKMVIHGSRANDTTTLIDGLPFNAMFSKSVPIHSINSGEALEFAYEVGAMSAETQTGGVRINLIPKSGGNTFIGFGFFGYGDHRTEGDNFTEKLRARGLIDQNSLEKVWDVNLGLGGPIRQDKLWFYGSFRHWGTNNFIAGMFFDQDPHDFVFTPDLTKQAINDVSNRSESLRLTWQATQKHKFGVYAVSNGRAFPHFGVSPTKTPEASQNQRNPLDWLGHLTWTAPLTNRLLFDVGMAIVRYDQDITNGPFSPPDILATVELSRGLNMRASASPYFRTKHYQNSYRGSMAYVTGSHAFKVGFDLQHGTLRRDDWINGDVVLRLRNGVPVEVQPWATPWRLRGNENAALGLFVQDQWTHRRMTLNAGLRYDYHNSGVPAQHIPAVRFLPERDYDAVECVPCWHDLSPRLGVAYDLFGDGKTAVKVTLSRYVVTETLELANNANPINTSVNNTVRQWTDLNGNFSPECDMTNPAPNGECGRGDPNFGQVRVLTRFDDDVLRGFGKREFNWETSASVQHELRPGVSVDVGYFRRWYGNFRVTDNLLVGPGDYSEYCVTAPLDSRLPGGGGNQLCGFYDINPNKLGVRDNLVTFAKNYGRQYEHFNGVDASITARLPRSTLLSGGVATGKTVLDDCNVAGKVDNPAVSASRISDVLRVPSPSTLYCHQVTPLLWQVKFLGSVNLPWDFQTSLTYQNLPGPQISADWVVPNALIAPSLGRNLSSGATARVELIEPGTTYEDRFTQVDFRLAKIFRMGRTRLQANVDLYNLFNASPVLRLITTFGPAWQRPAWVLPGRLFKFGFQVNF